MNGVMVGAERAKTENFNNEFLKYEGDLGGTSVKTLIDEVASSNNNKEYQVVVEFAGIGLIKNEELSLAKDYVISENTYNVSLGYDDNQIVNKVIIAGEFNGLKSTNTAEETNDTESAKNAIITAVNKGVNDYNNAVANGENSSNDLFTYVQNSLENLINPDTQMMKDYSNIKLEVMDNDSWLLVRITNDDGTTSRITVESNGYISQWMDR